MRDSQDFGGGFLGVDVFFVISGYLITRLVDAEIRQGEFSLLRFYERRVRRILPALYLVVIVSSIFAWLWMLPLEISDFERSVVAVALFGSNVFFNWEIGYFTSDIELWPLIHTWSLAVEEQFYAVFPLVLILLRRGRPKWAFAGIAALSAVSLAWAQWASQVDPQADFYLPQFRAWELGAGALVALAAPGPKVGARLRSGLAGLGAALLLLFFRLYAERSDAELVVARPRRRLSFANRLCDARQRLGQAASRATVRRRRSHKLQRLPLAPAVVRLRPPAFRRAAGELDDAAAKPRHVRTRLWVVALRRTAVPQPEATFANFRLRQRARSRPCVDRVRTDYRH